MEEKIRKTIEDYETRLRLASNRIVRQSLRSQLAAEIAELAEADKYDALQVQDATWHDIEDKHLADLAQTKKEMADAMAEMAEHSSKQLATAQAQVAVMAEALESLKADCEECGAPDEVEATGGYGLSATSVWELVNDALSAAPKVVWSGKVKRLKNGMFQYQFTAPFARAWNSKDWEELSRPELEVIVLDKQGEGE